MKVQIKLKKQLLFWFKKNKRVMPWRGLKDPYKIWVSEVMLQQTTSQAVASYYKNFIARFPNLKSLAKASEKDVYSMWQGLGYYSRARNLLKAARLLQKIPFPKTPEDLETFPSFGPYTSRAVCSLAYNAPVGVLDGNVIRVLSRFMGWKVRWWTREGRQKLQELADAWVKDVSSAEMNQALMELGSMICSRKPLCLLCPINKSCESFKNKDPEKLPLKQKKTHVEMVCWKPVIIKKQSRYAFIENKKLPFLKNKLILPGSFTTSKTKPVKYDFQHSITKYKIFVRLQKKQKLAQKDLIWKTKKEISRYNPSSLIQKALEFNEK